MSFINTLAWVGLIGALIRIAAMIWNISTEKRVRDMVMLAERMGAAPIWNNFKWPVGIFIISAAWLLTKS